MSVKANIKTLTSDELERHPACVKHAAESGPIFIVTDGAVSHVPMTKAEFDRLQGETDKSLRDVLMHPQGDEFDFEPPRMQGGMLGSSAFDWRSFSIRTFFPN